MIAPEDLYAKYVDLVSLRGHELVNVDNVRDKCERIHKWLTSSQSKKSLMLYGSIGNGKTTMLDAIVELHRKLKLQIIGITIKRLSECIVSENKDAFELYCSYPRLAIDDLGTQQPFVLDYGNKRYPFSELIEERYRMNLKTFISTNLSMEEIEELYGVRTSDRMKEMFDLMYYNEQSYRK